MNAYQRSSCVISNLQPLDRKCKYLIKTEMHSNEIAFKIAIGNPEKSIN